MDNNVYKLSRKANNAKMMTPCDALEEALADINSGAVSPTKLIVIMLDDRHGQYSTNFCQAGMSMSQVVALLEIMKHTIIVEQMGL